MYYSVGNQPEIAGVWTSSVHGVEERERFVLLKVGSVLCCLVTNLNNDYK
jgi:hypothetical protein